MPPKRKFTGEEVSAAKTLANPDKSRRVERALNEPFESPELMSAVDAALEEAGDPTDPSDQKVIASFGISGGSRRKYRGGAVKEKLIAFGQAAASGTGKYLKKRVGDIVAQEVSQGARKVAETADQALITTMTFVSLLGGVFQFLAGTTTFTLSNIAKGVSVATNWLKADKSQQMVADSVTKEAALSIAVAFAALIQAKMLSVSLVVAIMLRSMKIAASGPARAAATTAFYLWYSTLNNAEQLALKAKAAEYAIKAGTSVVGAAPAAVSGAKTVAIAMYPMVVKGLQAAGKAATMTLSKAGSAVTGVVNFVAAGHDQIFAAAAAELAEDQAGLKTATGEAAILLAGGAATESVHDAATDRATVGIVPSPAPMSAAAASSSAEPDTVESLGAAVLSITRDVGAAAPQRPASGSDAADLEDAPSPAAPADSPPRPPAMGKKWVKNPNGNGEWIEIDDTGGRRLTSRRRRRAAYLPRQTRRSSSGRRRGYSRRRRE